ncbi:MAG: T9SS type A sorting domain-containing protein [Bacteroidia bacterium]|nr:T9SS type A sorting domain-containing protein [Bacteroidia bacterium]
MRSFFFSIALFYLSLSSLGQTPDYFANDPKWHCGLWNSNQWNPPYVASTSTYVYYLNGDTTINGNVFHRLFSRGETVYSGPIPDLNFDAFTGYYLRQENRDIYSYTDTTERLLVSYDYSLGDTVRGSIFQACGFHQSTIQKIDSVQINSSYRKVFYLDSISGPLFTEGVGHQLQTNSSLGEFIMPLCQGVGFDYSISCFGFGSTAFWDSQGMGGNCLLNVGITEKNTGETIQIFPNPSSGSTWISFEKTHPSVSVVVYNVLGQEVDRKIFSNTSKINLNINGPSGVYYLVTTIDNKKTNTLKFIKQ